jgi:glycosyltransferase involved in cell wall biosynthesis
MNVLHINQSDIVGGAAIAAYRLHQGLTQQGIDSKLLVGNAQLESDEIVTTPPFTWLGKRLYRFTHQAGLNEIHLASTFNIPKTEAFQSADILNFHNLHTGYFNYLALPRLTREKPAVMTLHDMWSFTGHCVYSYECDRWKTGCGKCPYTDHYPEVLKDNTHLEWKLKQWTYRRSNLHIITLSKWLTQQVKQSILSHFPIYEIPNGIDTETYRPLDRKTCRQQLNLPQVGYVLLCAAVDFDDPRKGSELLVAAINRLPAHIKKQTTLAVLGNGGDKIEARLDDIAVAKLGYVSDNGLKAQIYAAADLFLCTSRADNLPLVLQESMACGTPMIAFETGGITDLVRDRVTGYLIQNFDVENFSIGIVKLLHQEGERRQLAASCRKIAIKEYSTHQQVSRYIELYQNILSRRLSER